MNNLALLLPAQGRLVEAKALARETLAGLRSTLGDAHPHTQMACTSFLLLLTAQGKHREARELKALPVRAARSLSFPCT